MKKPRTNPNKDYPYVMCEVQGREIVGYIEYFETRDDAYAHLYKTRKGLSAPYNIVILPTDSNLDGLLPP